MTMTTCTLLSVALTATTLFACATARTVGPVCEPDDLMLSCPADLVVGANVLGGRRGSPEVVTECGETPGDCQGTVPIIPNNCLWQGSDCSFTISIMTNVHDCRGIAQYLIAKNFQCVHPGQISKLSSGGVCDDTTLFVENVTYIQTENFPKVYPPTDCSREVVAPAGYGFRVQFLTMNFPSESAVDVLILEFGGVEEVYRGSPDHVDRTVSHSTMRVTFRSNQGSTHMVGINLRVSVVPLPDTTAGDYDTSTGASTGARHSSPDSAPPSAPATPAPGPPVDVILGVSAGAVLVLCVGLGVVIWHMRDRQQCVGGAQGYHNPPATGSDDGNLGGGRQEREVGPVSTNPGFSESRSGESQDAQV